MIELLVALTVVAVLGGTALLQPGMRQSRDRAQHARLQSEARLLRQAQLAYRAEFDRYYLGPFDGAAIRAAGFTYGPASDLKLTVESADVAHWNATLTLESQSGSDAEDGDAGPGSAPWCQLALSAEGTDRTNCMMRPGRRIEVPKTGNGAAPPPPDPINR